MDRQGWIPASELRNGECLSGLNGLVRIAKVRDTGRIESVYNFEVEGDHCYRVGQQGILVHNASAPNPCPAMNTQTTCTTRTVMPTSWYPGGSLEMSGGGVALVVNTASRTNLQTPPWWSTFLKTPPYDKSSWEKGHCIASRFSGMTGYCNFTAQYEYVNQSIFKVCENRIAEALGCGCIQVTVTPIYGADPVVPERFTIVAVGMGGNTYSLNVNFKNDPSEPVPADCMKKKT
jgi:hypothetical protein